eukprot:2414075-Alexandrium_andersonii.AAC.1
MSASLVGSEMCIRDSSGVFLEQGESPRANSIANNPGCQNGATSLADSRPVSYTHLTLPTICSV